MSRSDFLHTIIPKLTSPEEGVCTRAYPFIFAGLTAHYGTGFADRLEWAAKDVAPHAKMALSLHIYMVTPGAATWQLSNKTIHLAEAYPDLANYYAARNPDFRSSCLEMPPNNNDEEAVQLREAISTDNLVKKDKNFTPEWFYVDYNRCIDD
jgi:hypothetical protein